MAEPLKALVQEGLEKLCADEVLVNSREDSRNTRARAALAEIEGIERPMSWSWTVLLPARSVA